MAELTRRDLFKAAGATAAAIGVVSLRGPALAVTPGQPDSLPHLGHAG